MTTAVFEHIEFLNHLIYMRVSAGSYLFSYMYIFCHSVVSFMGHTRESELPEWNLFEVLSTPSKRISFKCRR